MAVSRKCADLPLEGVLIPSAHKALAVTLANHVPQGAPVAVACSGGHDSAVLAVHVAVWAQEHHVPCHLFHVHHGLQEPADAWQARVHELAARLNISCHSQRVAVDTSCGQGTESAARHARYQAFSALVDFTGVRHVVMAHHLNDQAETVLLRLLRGAGPAGLAAMQECTDYGSYKVLRPWLSVPRSYIERSSAAFTAMCGWQAVDDPSNRDPRYTRSAVRELLAPVLNQRWPGWTSILGRHAQQSAETALILHEVAQESLALLDPSADNTCFSLARWRQLPPPRQALVLRYWLSLHNVRMPTQARLSDWLRQLRGVHAQGHDRQLQLQHEGCVIRCIRGRVVLISQKK